MSDSRYEIVPKDEFLPIRFFTSFDRRLTRVAPHWHDYIEIIYLLSGKLELIINTHQFSLFPNDMIIIGSNHIHSTCSNDLETSAFVLQISMTFLKNNSTMYSHILFDKIINSHDDASGKLYYLKHLFKEFSAIEGIYNEYGNLKRTALLYDTLAVLIQYYSGSPTQSATQLKHSVYKYLNIIIDFISANYHQRVTLDEIAKQAGFTKYYLSRFFSKYVGMTVGEYITMLRLDEAYTLVLNSDLSLADISDYCGFANYPIFIKNFKNAYHMTPSNLRTTRKNNGAVAPVI